MPNKRLGSEIHEMVTGMYKAGVISETTLHEFDELRPRSGRYKKTKPHKICAARANPLIHIKSPD